MNNASDYIQQNQNKMSTVLANKSYLLLKMSRMAIIIHENTNG